METKVTSQTLTDTHKAVFTVTGVLGVFFVGLAFAFSLTAMPKQQTTTAQKTTVTTPAYFTLSDITAADLSAGPAATSTLTEISFQGVPGGVGNEALFGKFDYDSTSAFMDAQAYTSPYRLKVQINAQTHPAMYATVYVLGSLPATTPTSGLKLIPEANAQVTIAERKVICIPEKTTLGMLPVETQNDSKLFGLIPAAQAQVNININPPVYTNYYFDDSGNAYIDENLTQRASSYDCQTLVAKNFSPNAVSDVTVSGEVSLPANMNVTFAKSWNTVFGFYNTTEGYQSGNILDDLSHGGPLFIVGVNNEDASITYSRFTLTAETPLGTKNLCMPSRTLGSREWFLQYYDTNGNAYSDISLTQPLNCSTTINSCSNVICAKTPNHFCCIAAQVPQPAQ